MLILILINVQYSQRIIFSFEKGLIGQNHSSLGSHCPVKKFPPAKFLIPHPWGEFPPLLTGIWKILINNPDNSPPIIDLLWKFS